MRAHRDLAGDRAPSGRTPFAAFAAWAAHAGVAGPSLWALWSQVEAIDSTLAERAA